MVEDIHDNEIAEYDESLGNLLASTRIEEPLYVRKDTFKPSLFFGKDIPIVHRPGLYLHLLIVSLQYFFFLNTTEIINVTLDKTFHSVFENQFTYPLISASSYLLVPFIVYFCDRKQFSRYYLVLGTLLMAFLAGISLLFVIVFEIFENPKLQALNSQSNTTLEGVRDFIAGIEYSFTVLSLVVFELCFSLSYPFSITFGLDLLDGAPLETLLMYFPLFYIAKNLGGALAYLLYVRWLKTSFYIHCSIANFVLFIVLVLTILGRVLGYFKDSAIAANNFSFWKGLRLLISAFLLRFYRKKRTNYKSLMLYAARKNKYEKAKSLVDKTLAMTKINLIFLILTPLLSTYQILYLLFPEQAIPLNFLPLPVYDKKNRFFYCRTESYFISYWFINPITIIFSALIIEYFFYDIIFALPSDIPVWIRWVPRRLSCVRNNCLSSLRNKLRKHFTLVDPILKRVFWGLPFGLLSAICAITVESCRANFSVMLNCTDSSTFYASMVPLITQIPQYLFSGILETISIIGLLQYVYYLCSNHFQNSLMGFLFSLFFFYYGLAGVVLNIFNFTFNELCTLHCRNLVINSTNTLIAATNRFCLVYNSHCKSSIQYNSWAIWVVVIGVYLIMIPLFYLFSHYNHWKRSKEERLFQQESQQESL